MGTEGWAPRELSSVLSELRLEGTSFTAVGFSEPCPVCGSKKRRCLQPPTRQRKKVLVVEVEDEEYGGVVEGEDDGGAFESPSPSPSSLRPSTPESGGNKRSRSSFATPTTETPSLSRLFSSPSPLAFTGKNLFGTSPPLPSRPPSSDGVVIDDPCPVFPQLGSTPLLPPKPAGGITPMTPPLPPLGPLREVEGAAVSSDGVGPARPDGPDPRRSSFSDAAAAATAGEVTRQEKNGVREEAAVAVRAREENVTISVSAEQKKKKTDEVTVSFSCHCGIVHEFSF